MKQCAIHIRQGRKYVLLLILTVLTFRSAGQEIVKVIFVSQQADELPTKHGRPKYKIEFTLRENGELATSDFYENKKRRKLKNTVTIDKERAKEVAEWERLNKKVFNQSDLGLDVSTLKTQANSYNLNFDIPPDLIVCVDSFQFCQTYRMTKSISTGGETLSVTLIYEAGQKQGFIFDSKDFGDGNFNLKDYILCYTLLADRIPVEISSYRFFSKDRLADVVLYYQKTIECEGFYYKEFIEKNPGMTAKDKRMMTGWNFVEYMRQRNKKE